MSIVEKVNYESPKLKRFVQLVDRRDYRGALDYYNSLEDVKKEYLENQSDGSWRVNIIKKRGGRRF